jgi:hypothetical protein
VRRILALAVLAGTAALAAPASAIGACTPSHDGTTVGGCVNVVCLRLCVTQVEVDPQCHVNHPVSLPVSAACSLVDRQYVVIGG